MCTACLQLIWEVLIDPPISCLLFPFFKSAIFWCFLWWHYRLIWVISNLHEFGFLGDNKFFLSILWHWVLGKFMDDLKLLIEFKEWTEIKYLIVMPKTGFSMVMVVTCLMKNKAEDWMSLSWQLRCVEIQSEEKPKCQYFKTFIWTKIIKGTIT